MAVNTMEEDKADKIRKSVCTCMCACVCTCVCAGICACGVGVGSWNFK